MGLGYFRRKNKDYQDPLVSPSRTYQRDVWRWFRGLLIVAFLLFDLLGVIILFFPSVIYRPPSFNIGPQIMILPTQAGKLLQQAGATRSATASASTTPRPSPTKQPSPRAAAISTPTPSSSTPFATGTNPAINSAPGIYVRALRTDPQTPKRNQYIYFYVTFLNTTGATQPLRWDVLIYRAGNLTQYFGQSLPVGKGDSIGAGTVELRSSGPYDLFGGGGCEDVVVRIARMDGDKPGPLLTQPDGNPFSQSLTLCP